MAATKPQAKPKAKHCPPKLRASIKPGTVLILLAGIHRGKRVVFLKQLKSGLLLVNGPYKLNGVPLRRVNQAYVIATSTIIDISSLAVPESIDDAYFAIPKDSAKGKMTEAEFFGEHKEKKKLPLSDARRSDQKTIDSKLLSTITSQPFLKSYLSSVFSISKGTKVHELKF